MLIFLVKASTARTEPDFNVRSLAGSSGRLDVIARCVIAAFRTRTGVRRSVMLMVVLEGPPSPPKLLEIAGGELESVPESEVDVALAIADALRGSGPPGYRVRRESFRDAVLELLSREGLELYYLHERGKDIRTQEFGGRGVAFVLGDHLGLDKESEDFLDRLGVARISLGPRVYLTSHCITMVLDEFERRGLLGAVCGGASPHDSAQVSVFIPGYQLAGS
mgnify:CR=1 FL=1